MVMFYNNKTTIRTNKVIQFDFFHCIEVHYHCGFVLEQAQCVITGAFVPHLSVVRCALVTLATFSSPLPLRKKLSCVQKEVLLFQYFLALGHSM